MSRKRTGTLYGFADRLDYLIYKNGYSYSQLAKRLGCDRKTVYEWKNGATMPNGVFIVRLSFLLHTSPNYLLLGVDNDIKENIVNAGSLSIRGQMHISDYPEAMP